MPKAKSIIKDIKKYIITIPVSGSKKVSKLGTRVISIIIKNNLTSSLKVLLGYFLSNQLNIFVLVNINTSLANSLGWKEPTPGIVNQHLDPFTSVPNIKSKKSRILIKIYNKGDKSIIFLIFIFDDTIIIIKPTMYHINCL